jgi:hypothetical protein
VKHFVITAALLFASVSYAATVKFAWTFDTSATATCADGKTPASACTATGFEIQEKDANGIWVVKEGVAATVRSRDYSGIANGVTKCYRVRVNAGGTYSEPSAEACVPVPFAQPKTTQTVTATVTVVTP